MKGNHNRNNIPGIKLLYFIIFAFFVLFQGIQIANIDTIYLKELFVTEGMLLGYLTILFVLPLLIIFFMYLPLFFLFEYKVMFDFCMYVQRTYHSQTKVLKHILYKQIKQSSLGVFRC
jgi:magnesium-transporting ATPase (P-type)